MRMGIRVTARCNADASGPGMKSFRIGTDTGARNMMVRLVGRLRGEKESSVGTTAASQIELQDGDDHLEREHREDGTNHDIGWVLTELDLNELL